MHDKIINLSSSLIIIFLSLFIFINHDIAIWFEIIENNSLKLYSDIIEVNFPASLSLYYFPAKMNLISNFYSSFFLYLELLSLIIFIYYLIKKYIPNLDIKFYELLIILFIGSLFNFGQRDSFIIILLTPYILLSIQKFKTFNSDFNFSSIIIFLAALAIMIKPVYVLIVIIIELTNSIRFNRLNKNNILLFLSLGLFYCLSIFIFLPDFYLNILPLLGDYLNGFSSNNSLFSILFIFISIALLLFKNVREYHFIEWLILFVMSVVLLIQKHSFVYYFIPIITFVLFLVFFHYKKYFYKVSILIFSVSFFFFVSQQLSYKKQNELFENIQDRKVLIFSGISDSYPFLYTGNKEYSFGAPVTIFLNSKDNALRDLAIKNISKNIFDFEFIIYKEKDKENIQKTFHLKFKNSKQLNETVPGVFISEFSKD